MIGLFSQEVGRRESLREVLRALHYDWTLKLKSSRNDNLKKVLRELHHDWTFKHRRRYNG